MLATREMFSSMYPEFFSMLYSAFPYALDPDYKPIIGSLSSFVAKVAGRNADWPNRQISTHFLRPINIKGDGYSYACAMAAHEDALFRDMKANGGKYILGYESEFSRRCHLWD
jgi:hypothetical protein